MQKSQSDLPQPYLPIDRELAFETFFECAPMMMGIAEVEGDDIRHIYDNEAAGIFFAIPAQQMSGKLASELLVPKAAIDNWIHYYRLAERTGKPQNFEYKHPTRVEEQYFHVTVSYMGKNHGGYPRFSYIVQDITETRLAQLKLQEINAELEQKVTERTQELELEKVKMGCLVHSSPIGIAFLDKDLRYEIINPVLAAYNGAKPEDHIGRNVEEILPDRAKNLIPSLRRVLEKGESIQNFEYESDTVLAPGEKHNFLANYFPVKRDGEVLGLGATVFDTTFLKDAEKNLKEAFLELERQKMSLEEERDLREQFVATLSHDLRTPLTAARMSAQMISRKVHELETVTRSAYRIVDNLDRADGMIRDLLDVSRARAGEELHMERAECNLGTLVSDTLDDLSTVYGDRFECKKAEEIIGHWSCSGLRRILENLCSNAIKYGSPDTRVRVSLEKQGEFVLIHVHNRGNPIPREKQADLFHPFRRFEDQKKGWGLGLTLVKALTTAHGGEVSLKSEADSGTVFTVKLPLN